MARTGKVPLARKTSPLVEQLQAAGKLPVELPVRGLRRFAEPEGRQRSLQVLLYCLDGAAGGNGAAFPDGGAAVFQQARLPQDEGPGGELPTPLADRHSPPFSETNSQRKRVRPSH